MGWGVIYPSPHESKQPFACGGCGAEHDSDLDIESCDGDYCATEICPECVVKCADCSFRLCRKCAITFTAPNGAERSYCERCARLELALRKREQVSRDLTGFELLTKAIAHTGDSFTREQISFREMSERFGVLYRLRGQLQDAIIAATQTEAKAA